MTLCPWFRSLVSVLSHDTSLGKRASLPCFANCRFNAQCSARCVCDLRSVCATELEAYIGDCTCNLRNSVAARWPFQIFSIKSIFNCQLILNCKFVTEESSGCPTEGKLGLASRRRSGLPSKGPGSCPTETSTR